MHIVLPIARDEADGIFNMFYKPPVHKGESKDIPEVPLTTAQIEARDLKLKRARIQANLDVNFHEYQVCAAFVYVYVCCCC
jgi:hypothetical protein